MKILYTSNIPSPYTVNFLDTLSNKADVTAIFEKSKSNERHPKWKSDFSKNLRFKILKGIPVRTDQSIAPQIILRSFKKYDFIIVSNFFTPTGIILIFYLNMINVPYLLMSEGGFSRNDSWFIKKLKNYVISKAFKCLSGSSLGEIFYKHYGAIESNISKYPFTSIYDEEVLLKNEFNSLSKAKLKKNLNLNFDKVIISVGQVIPRKGHDILLKAFRKIPNNEKYGLLIVGGKPNHDLTNLINEQDLPNLIFIDFLSKAELLEYYKASDLFVLPTREDEYGLVINEAMACGLPVITTKRCGAGVELIEEKLNGFLVEVEEVNQLSIHIQYLLENDEIANEISINNLNKIKNYTFEKWSHEIYEYLNSIY